jgi:uncharacterized protein (DUF1778 family)
MTSTEPRTQRINLPATTHEVAVLRQASALAGTTLTSFVLFAAVTAAEGQLASAVAVDPNPLSTDIEKELPLARPRLTGTCTRSH